MWYFFKKNKFLVITLVFIILIIGGIIVAENPAIMSFFITLSNRNLRPGSFTHPILIPDTVSNLHPPPNLDRSLRNISLVRQHDTFLCVAASIYMIENYYFGENYFAEVPYDYRDPTSWVYLREIFDQIAVYDNEGRAMGGGWALAAQYMENRGLYAGVVYFHDFKEILMYMETNKIPAILNIQSIGSYLFSHAVVFTGYNPEEDIIYILDPGDPNNTFISGERFMEITRNTIIIVADRLNIERAFFCPIDNRRMAIDESILDAISGLFCPGCGTFSYIPGSAPL